MSDAVRIEGDGLAAEARSLTDFLRNEQFAVRTGAVADPPGGATLRVRPGAGGPVLELGGASAPLALPPGWATDPAALWSILAWLAEAGVTLAAPARRDVARLEDLSERDPRCSWSTYEDPAFVERYRSTWQDRPVPPTLMALLAAVPADGIVLDLGCGPGVHTREIARHTALAIGVDPARAWISTEALADRVPRRLQADGRRLPIGDARVDGVWCCAVLVHLVPPDRRAALAEIRRVLRPDGVVGLCLAVGKQPAVEAGRLFVPYGSDAEWEDELVAAGLRPTDHEVVVQASTTAGGARVARWVNVIARRAAD